MINLKCKARATGVSTTVQLCIALSVYGVRRGEERGTECGCVLEEVGEGAGCITQATGGAWEVCRASIVPSVVEQIRGRG